MTTTKSRTSRIPQKDSPARVFGNRLAELRQQGGLTVEKFAELFAAKPNTVRDWLNARVLPRAEALVGIARHFGVSIDWLLGMEGAPKHPTQWRKMEEFEHELAVAIVDRVGRRGGVAAALIEEFEVDGSAALESLADQVESDVVARAEQRAKWVAQRDAFVAVNGEFNDLVKMVTALRTAALPVSDDEKEEKRRNHKRQNAQRTIDAIPNHGSRIVDAVGLALVALQSALSEHKAPVRAESISGRAMVNIATSTALSAGIARDQLNVDQRLIDQDLATSRRIAQKHQKAKRGR